MVHESCSPPDSGSAIEIERVSEVLFGLLGDNESVLGTNQTKVDALRILQYVANESTKSTASASDPSETESLLQDLSLSATKAAYYLCRISSSSRQPNKLTWHALQDAAAKFHDGGGRFYNAIAVSESDALAVSLVFGALSLADPDIGSKAAASAMSSTILRNKPLKRIGGPLASQLLRTYLTHAIDVDTIQLQILNHFAKAFTLRNDSIESNLTAKVVRKAIRLGDDASWTTPLPGSLFGSEGDAWKQRVSGALALACQLQPWSVLSPVGLVDAAISFDLWHSAEEACRAAQPASRPTPSTDSTDTSAEGLISFSLSQQENNARVAVERLIDAALENRMFRRADCLATNLYEIGGQSRYIEARYYHACETISKVISRKQIAIVDRQIERVDKAVAKVRLGGRETTESKIETTEKSDSTETDFDDSSQLIFNPSIEIRKFAMEKLEQGGEITAAQRLASLYGIAYVQDEQAIMLAVTLRREKYLQYDDVLRGSIPNLIARPEDLRLSFASLLEHPHQHGPIGFDAEWDDETTGASVLQLANADTALLLDIPALSSTEEGVKALKETVGQLLGCSDSVVAGFACRQDLSQLRASPCVGTSSGMKNHWMSGTQAVVDIQTLVGRAEPKLFKAGLSRVCQFYFNKPLDKAEQCSIWSARPLSYNQRAYAALDAWVCVGIYSKLGGSVDKLVSEPLRLEKDNK